MPRKPVTLSLAIDYAVCEKLCVPADGKAELTLTGKAGGHDAKLQQSEALVPRPPRSAKATARDPRREARGQARHRRRRGARGRAVDLFAEGPTAEWALPVPAPVARGRQQRFTFELDGLPPNTKPDGATLTLTAVAGEQAIEVPYRLD